MRERENPEVIAHLEAENAYTEAKTAGLADLQQRLYDEFLSRIKQTDESAPSKDGDYWYYSRTVEGLNYPIFCRRKGSPTAPEEVYLDVNKLAEGKDYIQVTGIDVSTDGRLLAYLVDETGYESCTLRFRDLETGKDLADELTDVAPFSLTWAAGEPVVFYTRVDDTKRSNRVMRYRLGDGAAKEVEVFREDDVKFNVGVGRTRSDAFMLIFSGSSTTSEVHAIDATKPESALRVLRPRAQGVQYSVDHQSGPDAKWWFITDADGAMNYKVMTAPIDEPANWKQAIAHSDDVLIEDIDCFDGYTVLSERRGGFTAVRVLDLASGAERILHAPEDVAVMFLGANDEYTTPTIRIAYQSPVTPSSIYDVTLASDEWSLVKRTEVLGGYDPSRYEVKRVYAVAPDGAKVPMSVVHRKGLALDGTNPAYLYAYGSYGFSMEPSFRSNLVSLLDRGVVCATAHVRGGSEMGRAWKENGKMMHKMNTFTDFIACAETLIRDGYTTPQRLAIEGGSAGGLLIGAVVNLRPDLFQAAHAAVPFVDVVTTMLDDTIPLTTGEYEEWGNPNESDAYRYMKSYSPYDNVGAKDYPHMLITSGLNDPRVAYWEPAKWTARLRERSTSDNDLLLKMHMGAGHGGSSGRYARLKETAFEWGFLLDKIGAGSLEPITNMPAKKAEPVGSGS
jgi:oligopeptidase B